MVTKAKPPAVLADMRKVYGQPKAQDKTPAEKTLRKVYEENPAQFIRDLTRLEKEFAAQRRQQRQLREEKRREKSKEVATAQPDCPPDGRSQQLRELIGDVLSEYGKEAKDVASNGNRPGDNPSS
jgi:hypothetical protein